MLTIRVSKFSYNLVLIKRKFLDNESSSNWEDYKRSYFTEKLDQLVVIKYFLNLRKSGLTLRISGFY